MLQRSLLYAKNVMMSARRYKKDSVFPVIDASHRQPLPCCCLPYVGRAQKPCFDINNIVLERCFKKYVSQVKSFLHSQYFTREPNLVSLNIPHDSPYLEFLAKMYTCASEQWLAFDVEPRTGEKTIVGLLVCNKKFPWEVDVCYRHAKSLDGPERVHMCLRAHCFNSPNVFEKFKVPFVYNVEVLVTKADAGGQGLGELLLAAAMLHALEMRYKVVQFISTNSHMDKACKRANMEVVWSMNYSEFTDQWGRVLLQVRHPHTAVKLFVFRFDPNKSSIPDEKEWPALYKLFQKQVQDKEYSKNPGMDMYPPLPKCPSLEHRSSEAYICNSNMGAMGQSMIVT